MKQQLYISLLLALCVTMHAADEAGITPKQFLAEITSKKLQKITQFSENANHDVHQKAKLKDFCAMRSLAVATDNADIPAMVPMYWVSKLSLAVDQIETPEERDLLYKKWAESYLTILDSKSRLRTIEILEKMDQHEQDVLNTLVNRNK